MQILRFVSFILAFSFAFSDTSIGQLQLDWQRPSESGGRVLVESDRYLGAATALPDYRTLKLYDHTTRRYLGSLTGNIDINSADISRDSRWLVTGGFLGEVAVWSLDGREQIAQWKTAGSPGIGVVKFAANARILIAQSPNAGYTPYLYDALTGIVRDSFPNDPSWGLMQDSIFLHQEYVAQEESVYLFGYNVITKERTRFSKVPKPGIHNYAPIEDSDAVILGIGNKLYFLDISDDSLILVDTMQYGPYPQMRQVRKQMKIQMGPGDRRIFDLKSRTYANPVIDVGIFVDAGKSMFGHAKGLAIVPFDDPDHLQFLEGHWDSSLAAVLSNDGKYLVSSSWPTRSRIYESEHGVGRQIFLNYSKEPFHTIGDTVLWGKRMLDPRSGRAIDSLRRDPLQVMEAAGMIYFLYPDSIERAPRHSIHELDRLRYYERPFSFPLERMATNGRDRIAISAFDSVWLVDTSYTLIARAEILWRGSKLAVVGDSLYLIDTAISLLKAGGKLLHLHSLGGSLVSTITIQDTGFFFTINTGWDEEALYRFDARDNRLTLHATKLAPARWLYHPTDGELWSIDRRGSINKYSVGQPLAKLDPPIETDDHQHLVTSFGVLNNTLKISFRDCEFGLVEVFDLLGRPLGMGALEQEVEINLNGVSDALLLKCTSIAGSHLHRLKVR